MYILKKADEISRQAMMENRMKPIEVTTRHVSQADGNYLLRIAHALGQKERVGQRQKPVNPFLPYEEALYVADLGPDHVCLLNKYPVIANHLLLITRHFEPQESLLTLSDIRAMTELLQQADGLMFYNSGALAGASQSHKHMQWVPRTLGEPTARLPLEPGESPLPFAHCWYALPQLEAQTVYDSYRQALATLQWHQGLAYNLLLTRQWLLLVPRHQASWQQISINSLAFVGSFFVKDQAQADRLLADGFTQALDAVSGWPAEHRPG